MHYALIQIIDRRPEAISQLLSMYVDKWPTVSRPKCSIDKIYLWKNGLVIDNYEYVLSLHVPRNSTTAWLLRKRYLSTLETTLNLTIQL